MSNLVAVQTDGARWNKAAIVGVGITEMGKIYGRSAADFAAEAIALALDDAGLQKSDIDGLLVNGNGNVDMTPYLQLTLGFEDLAMLNVMSAAGSTSGAMIQYAALALDAGIVNNVVLLYADAPLRENVGAAAAYAARGAWNGMNGLRGVYGEFGGNPPLRARRAQAHAPVRDDQRAARRDRGGAAQVGADEPAGADAQADDARGPPELADGGRAVPPLRLLPRLERRGRA